MGLPVSFDVMSVSPAKVGTNRKQSRPPRLPDRFRRQGKAALSHYRQPVPRTCSLSDFDKLARTVSFGAQLGHEDVTLRITPDAVRHTQAGFGAAEAANQLP